MGLWDEFRPVRRVTRVVVAVYLVLTVGVPSALARAQFLRATADGLPPSSRFAGTVVVFSAALLALVAIAALFIYFRRENIAKNSSVGALVHALPPSASQNEWQVLVGQTREHYEKQLRDKDEAHTARTRAFETSLKTSNDTLTKARESLNWYQVEYSKVKEERDALKSFEEAVRFNKAQGFSPSEEMRKKNEALQSQVEGLRAQEEKLRLAGRKHFEQLRYGRTIEGFSPMDKETAAAIRLRIDEMGNGLNQINLAAGAMWSQVSNEIEEKHANTALAGLWERVASHEVMFMNNASALYWETSQTVQSADMRPLLVLFCLTYFDQRFAILRLAELAEHPADVRHGYTIWRDREIAFFTDLQKAVGSNAMDPVRVAIRRYFSEHRGRIIKVTLPPEELALPAPRALPPQSAPSNVAPLST